MTSRASRGWFVEISVPHYRHEQVELLPIAHYVGQDRSALVILACQLAWVSHALG